MKKIIRMNEMMDYPKWERELDKLLMTIGYSVDEVGKKGLSLYPASDFWEEGFTPKEAFEYIEKEIERDEY